MKNRKRIYLLLVLLICINTINVYASENIDISLSTESDQENTTEVPLDETIDNNFEIITVDETIDYSDFSICDEISDDYREIMESESISTFSTSNSGDNYEPNNSRETAYPYKNTKTITDTISFDAQLYTLGMKNATLHSKEDQDWYYLDVKKGDELFIDLRNIGMQNWRIEIFYTENGKSYRRYAKEEVFAGKPEVYYTYTITETQRMYIKIYTLGDWNGESYYYFYVGPHTNVKYKIKNYNIGSTVITNDKYSTPMMLNLKKAVPPNSYITELAITNDFSSGSCRCLDKKIYTTSKNSYKNANGTGNEEINLYSSKLDLSKIWYVSGKCGCLKYPDIYNVTWAPRLNASFYCTMGPYPGNDIN